MPPDPLTERAHHDASAGSAKDASTPRPPAFDLEQLHRQRRILAGKGRLHWAHLLIVGLSIAVTIVAWQTSRNSLIERNRLRFEHEATQVVELMQERLRHYEDALLSGVASMQVRPDRMTRAEWRRYTESLDLRQRYPGISGLGVIYHVPPDALERFVASVRRKRSDFRVHPTHDNGLHLPITYIEPEADNAAAVGLDVAFETNRRQAAVRALQTGTTQISGPITLVQDAGKTPGFLFYAPFRASANAPLRDGGQETYPGFVYAPLVVRHLVAGVLGEARRNVWFEIADGDTHLYADTHIENREQSAFRTTRDVELYGRTWTFEIGSRPGFLSAPTIDQPLMVLLLGLALECLLVLMLVLLHRNGRRILRLARTMTDDLSEQALALTASNDDLRTFAHVVSHDLKNPIRNIQDVTEFLEEDLALYLASNEVHPEVPRHLSDLRNQAQRGQTLIDGILDYSRVGAAASEPVPVDTDSLLREIATNLHLAPERFSLVGDFPVLETDPTRLGQVFENLIGNAYKYNPCTETAAVVVAADRFGGHARFAIRDNGPGIEARFHSRIFEPFETLATPTDLHSSGIGLSIVKRAVDRQGGRIEVLSEPGAGATFRFTWPAVVVAPPGAQAA